MLFPAPPLPALTPPGHACNIEIQALRGIAVAVVILSHAAPLWPWLAAVLSPFEPGTVVDLFFAISGFVIARSLLPSLRGLSGAGRLAAIRAFYIRRSFRILPSAWLWMAIVVVLSLAFNRSGSFATPAANLADAAAMLLNLANLHFHACYYGGAAGCGNNAIYWSLSLEEQFYLLLPLVACLPQRWFAGMLVAAVAIQLPLARTPLLLMTRSDAICLGVLLALLPEAARAVAMPGACLRHPWLRRSVTAALLSALVLVCGPWGLGSLGWGVASLLSIVILWLASHDCGCLIGEGRPRRWLAWVGQRSFALYLIHNPVIWAAQEVWSRLGPIYAPWTAGLLATAAAASMLMLADLNFRIVEAPMTRQGRRIAGRVAFQGTVA